MVVIEHETGGFDRSIYTFSDMAPQEGKDPGSMHATCQKGAGPINTRVSKRCGKACWVSEQQNEPWHPLTRSTFPEPHLVIQDHGSHLIGQTVLSGCFRRPDLMIIVTRILDRGEFIAWLMHLTAFIDDNGVKVEVRSN
ncbi:hypothetical protein ES702_00104 [subsurface metagenome]